MIETLRFVEGGRRQRVAVSRIEYLTGEGNYSRIHFADRPSALVSYCLKIMESQLPDFVRIHKTTLVNLRHVKGYNLKRCDDASIKLSGGRSLPVARRRAQLLSSQLC